MDYCIVENGIVTNIIVCDSNEIAAQFGARPITDGDTIGGVYGLLAKKKDRIAQSKADLAAYLGTHPLLWTDKEHYSITSEKQQQLTSKLMVATMAQTLSTPYDLTWNSTGEVCKSWALQDLSALAFAIDSRVTALVSYQQAQEVAMRNAETQEALDAIVVDYDSVPLPGGTA